MIFIIRKRRGVVKKRWYGGSLKPISIQLGCEHIMVGRGLFLWFFNLELILHWKVKVE